MGDRLGNFKPFDKTFTMSYFSMILINEQGKIMGHVKHDNTDNFYLSLILEQRLFLAVLYINNFLVSHTRLARIDGNI